MPVLCIVPVNKQSLASKFVNLTRKVSNEIILSGGEEGIICVWESRTVSELRFKPYPAHSSQQPDDMPTENIDRTVCCAMCVLNRLILLGGYELQARADQDHQHQGTAC